MIPVNLITGFLGVGKTTLIRHLLAQVPANEYWAVLVNEFGEAGIDGALIKQAHVAVEEVAGGCLCCVAAPAFTVGLNRLIRQHRPTRILIEPSGLGHPAQVLEQLRSPLYAKVLDIRATLTVIDARHLSSVRHREHPTFVDQIHLADVLIANKSDSYSAHDEQALLEYVAKLRPQKQRMLITEQGQIDRKVLDLGSEHREAAFPEAHAFLLDQSLNPAETPTTGWLQRQSQQDGYHSAGWLIDASFQFTADALMTWLDSLTVERVKASVNCGDRQLHYNRTDTNEPHIEWLPDTDNTRIQLIDSQALPIDQLESTLRQTSR